MCLPWRWGEADCCCSAWSAFAAWHGLDPRPPFTYRTRREANALIAGFGGFISMAEALADRFGLVPGDGPGAIGTDGKTMMVCIGPWIGKTQHGVATYRGAVLRAWRPGSR